MPCKDITILAVSNDDDYLDGLTELEHHLIIKQVSAPSEALESLEQGGIDIIVSDHFPGEESFLREVKQNHDIPFIYYTIEIDEDTILNAFEQGAEDYFFKTGAKHNYLILCKRIESILEKHWTESLQYDLIHITRDACAIIQDNVIIIATQAMADILDVGDVSEIIGAPVSNWIDLQAFESFQSRQSRTPISVMQTIQTETLPKKTFESFSTPITYKGKPASILFLRDITQHEEMRRALKESEGKYRSLIELSPDVIFTVSHDGYITSINPAIMTLTGYSPDEFIGLHFTDLHTTMPEHVLDFDRILEDSREGKVLLPIEIRIPTKNNGFIWLEARVSELVINEEKSGFIAVLRDITRRKETEASLVEQAEQLEKKVLQRTNELLDAERAATLGKLAAMIAHDLRGPLTTIRNAVGLFSLSEDKHDIAIRMIEKNSTKAIRMVNELRNWNITPIRKSEGQLNQLIENVLKDLYFPTSITVQLDLEETPDIQLDSLKIQRVIENLIENALDAMQTPGTLTIRTTNHPTTVKLEVKDTGIGMSESDLEMTFDLFFTTKKDGMGLGLPYCKQIIDAHDGTIKLDSVKGEGTTVTVNFPK